LAAELRSAFPYADVQLLQSAGGVFEVVVDGRLIFSKKKLKRHAERGEVVKLIGRR
jgi:selT/selW/selH-like putative selenoprotein